MRAVITVQQDSSDLSVEIKRGLSLIIFINSSFHSWKARICVAECSKAPVYNWYLGVHMGFLLLLLKIFPIFT